MTLSKRLKLDTASIDKECKIFINELELLNNSEDFSGVKSFIIFGNSLYPNDFHMKFAGYEYIKLNKDYKMAASLLNEMYSKFPNELYGELEKILEDIKLPEISPNKEIFYCLHAQVQYDILRKFIQTLDTPYDQVVLLLEVIKAMSNNISSSGTSKYHQLVANEIIHLVNLLSEAETDWKKNFKMIKNNMDPILNFYRYLLATEVLPIVHRAPKGVLEIIDKRKLTDIVMKSLQFYLAYAGFVPDVPSEMPSDAERFVVLKITTNDLTATNNEFTITDIWTKLKCLLSMAGDLLKWHGSLTSYGHRSHQVAVMYENLSTNSYCMQVKALLDYAGPSTGNKQLMLIQQLGCVVWVGLAELIINYLRLTKPYLWYAGNQDLKFLGSVFLFCKGEATGRLVNYQRNSKRMKQIHQAFSIATKLYATVPIKEWDKISEKVEPFIRSQSWGFDSMFFLDLALLRGPLVKSKTYLKDPRLKSVYPKPYRDLLYASINQCNRDKNKKTLKNLIDILNICSSKLNENFRESFEELPEMVTGYTYLIEFNANNILMLIVHFLHGWLTSVATARNPLAPLAAGFLLVLLQIKKVNFKSLVSQNCFILVQEGTSGLSMKFFDFIISVEIIEEIISQIRIYERTNPNQTTDENKDNFIKTLNSSCIERVESESFSKPKSIEILIFDFIKCCKNNLLACIG